MPMIDPALYELVDEQREHNAVLMQTTAQMKAVDTTSPEGLAWLSRSPRTLRCSSPTWSWASCWPIAYASRTFSEPGQSSSGTRPRGEDFSAG